MYQSAIIWTMFRALGCSPESKAIQNKVNTGFKQSILLLSTEISNQVYPESVTTARNCMHYHV